MILKNSQRFSLPNEDLERIYGPLSALIGTWAGNKGVNLIAVPDQKGEFTLLVAPYSETLTITPTSSPTPNRGLTTIEELPTLMYTLSIYNSITNSLMHVENGVWNLLNATTNSGFDIARIATVPHGDAILALGVASKNPGKPKIDPKLSSLPTGDLPPLFGYKDPYDAVYVDGFITKLPNQYLIDYLAQQEKNGFTVTQTTNLPVSTLNKGGITNIPSINNNAKATTLSSIFWVETVLDKSSGQTFQQLQYSQSVVVDFPVKNMVKKGGTIHWPHISVNTLVKQ